MMVWIDQPPPYGQLVGVSGLVVDTFLLKGGKNHSKVHLLIQAANGLHDCVQEASNLTVPLLNVPKGADVSALVRYGAIANPGDQLWEFRTGNVKLLKYENLVDREDEMNQRTSLAIWAFGLLAIIFLGAAMILRRKFGGWREPPLQSVPQ